MKTCCIPALYSIMILFLYWNVWVYFLQQLGVFYLAVARLLSGGERCAAASDLPAESVAAFVDWNICCTTRGGQEAGSGPLPTLIQTSLENLTRNKSTDRFDLVSGPVAFLTDQIVRKQRWYDTRCIFELYAVTVQDCRKRQQQIVKRAFCVYAQQHTGGIAFLGFLYKLWKFFFCVFTFSYKQLCEKCLQRVLKSETCIR